MLLIEMLGGITLFIDHETLVSKEILPNLMDTLTNAVKDVHFMLFM